MSAGTLTSADMAKALGCTISAFYCRVSRMGIAPASREGTRKRWHESDLERLKARRYTTYARRVPRKGV